MSDHQSGARGAPEQRSGMETQGYGGSPEGAAKGPEGPGAAGGYGEAQAGLSQGSQPGRSESAGGQPGYGAAQGQPQGYVAPQGNQPGYGESMGPVSGREPFMHGGAGAMPPGYGQPHTAQPAFAPGYHQTAPHYAAAAMYYGQYAGYPPPPPPPGAYPYPPEAFQAPHQGYAHGAAHGAGQAHGASVSDLVNEVANGGNGLSTISKMLNFDDPDFWKGALVGAAAVLLLTSGSVQSALFGSNGNGGKDSSA
ncbi:hypothetical protein [Allochromatium vinosum]|uniref:hypothetical protein n=1 Tax=Allochromatium vinosum TaxID=1049 RepID=UPI001908DA64|nr:hypothetical protein [Allochromatium vinosum]MBK1653380.1 hypothetical protein [Allochromatium vinosum]